MGTLIDLGTLHNAVLRVNPNFVLAGLGQTSPASIDSRRHRVHCSNPVFKTGSTLWHDECFTCNEGEWTEVVKGVKGP